MTTEPHYPVRATLAGWLRAFADRLDQHGAPRATHLTFTVEDGHGVQVRTDGRGCRLWYLSMDDYYRAYTDADCVRRPERGPAGD